MAENAVKEHAVSKKTRQLINAKTERACNNLVKISEKFNFSIIKSFNEWKIYTEFRKAEDNILYSNNKKIAEINDNIDKNQKKLESLNKRKDDLENDLKDLKKRKKEQQEYLKDLENEKQSLEWEHLEKQLKVIEAENLDLQEKLNSTQSNVGSFIHWILLCISFNRILQNKNI